LPTLNMFLIFIIGLGLIIVAAQNTAPIEIRFLWFSAKVPIIILMLIVIAMGFALGFLVPVID
jgi:uncharacterized integral membrane protein